MMQIPSSATAARRRNVLLEYSVMQFRGG